MGQSERDYEFCMFFIAHPHTKSELSARKITMCESRQTNCYWIDTKCYNFDKKVYNLITYYWSINNTYINDNSLGVTLKRKFVSKISIKLLCLCSKKWALCIGLELLSTDSS